MSKHYFYFSYLFSAIIVSSAFYARPLYNFIIATVSRQAVSGITYAIILLAFAFAIFLKYTSKAQFNLKNWRYLFQLPVSAIILFTLSSCLELPEERIHLVLYGSLGLLRSIELSIGNKHHMSAMFLVLACSFLSECLQSLIPGRFGDLRDIIVDCSAGLAGALLNPLTGTSKRNTSIY